MTPWRSSLSCFHFLAHETKTNYFTKSDLWMDKGDIVKGTPNERSRCFRLESGVQCPPRLLQAPSNHVSRQMHHSRSCW